MNFEICVGQQHYRRFCEGDPVESDLAKYRHYFLIDAGIYICIMNPIPAFGHRFAQYREISV